MTISNKLSALEYYPNRSEKKWAVLYGTWGGSSRDAAVWISEGMDGIANVFDVRENPVKVRTSIIISFSFNHE